MNAAQDIRDGMVVEWDVGIPMDDGVVLRADIFRPLGDDRVPVIMTHGPYAKGLAWQDGYPTVWESHSTEHPEAIAGSSNLYQNWETLDPEKWVPAGYACMRVDSRGAGRSPGRLDVWSPRETRDFYDCIEWAASQPWCNGKVGLSGISYYAMNQWQVAAMQPPHLAAICVWEGAADWYRDVTHHGGIFTTFTQDWFHTQVRSVQHGLGERGPRSRVTGELVCGPETLGDEELAQNIADFGEESLAHPFVDDHWNARTPDPATVTVPLLSAANWGGNGLHHRGNFEAFLAAASEAKWLEVHGLQHWTHYYTPYGQRSPATVFRALPEGGGHRLGRPAARAAADPSHRQHLRRAGGTRVAAGTNVLDALLPRRGGPAPDGLDTGFIQQHHLRRIGSRRDVPDASIRDGYRDHRPAGRQAGRLVRDRGRRPVPRRQGLCTGSRRSDVPRQHRPPHPGRPGLATRLASEDRSRPDAAVSAVPSARHARATPPGEPVELDIEIWPTCVVVPAGYRLGLSVRGTDYVYPGEPVRLSNVKRPLRGNGPYNHDEPRDRPGDVFGGNVTLHIDRERPSYLLVPIIPPD